MVKDREAWCCPWGHKESDTTARLNNKNTILDVKTSPQPSSHVQFPDTAVLKQSPWAHGWELGVWFGLSWAAPSSLQDSTFTCSESDSGLTGAEWSKMTSLTWASARMAGTTDLLPVVLISQFTGLASHGGLKAVSQGNGGWGSRHLESWSQKSHNSCILLVKQVIGTAQIQGMRNRFHPVMGRFK